jgi:endonuclease/exonuclease/phosphatase family metal-dependent hydrolase
MVMGDLNIETNKLEQIMAELGVTERLAVHNVIGSRGTRPRSDGTVAEIDHFIVSERAVDKLFNGEVLVTVNDISDHLPIYCRLRDSPA